MDDTIFIYFEEEKKYSVRIILLFIMPTRTRFALEGRASRFLDDALDSRVNTNIIFFFRFQQSHDTGSDNARVAKS